MGVSVVASLVASIVTAMGLKSAKSKKAKLDVKRNLKASEKCPHCKIKVVDLECHLREAHGHICVRCGQRFSSERQWMQHMRDKHGLNESSAVRDDRTKRIEKWAKKDRKEKAPERAEAMPTLRLAAAESEMAADDSEEEQGHTGLYKQKCELCGAEAMLPVDLVGQGLSFTCAYLGRQCQGQHCAASTARQAPFAALAGSPAAPLFGFSVPAVQSFTIPCAAAATAAPLVASAPISMDAAVSMAVPSDDEDL